MEKEGKGGVRGREDRKGLGGKGSGGEEMGTGGVFFRRR